MATRAAAAANGRQLFFPMKASTIAPGIARPSNVASVLGWLNEPCALFMAFSPTSSSTTWAPKPDWIAAINPTTPADSARTISRLRTVATRPSATTIP